MLILWIRSMFLLPLLIFCQECTKGMSQHSTLFSFFPKVTPFFQTKSCFCCPMLMELWVMREVWGKSWSAVAWGLLALPTPTALSPEFTCNCCGHGQQHTSAPTIYMSNEYHLICSIAFPCPQLFRNSHNLCLCHIIIAGYSHMCVFSTITTMPKCTNHLWVDSLKNSGSVAQSKLYKTIECSFWN